MRRTKEHGITLIALVITIIVLLILAGIALHAITGNSSIIDNANYAVGEYNKSANVDQNVITKAEDLFAQYLEGDAEYRITYYANGGTGTMDEEEASRAGTSTFIPPEGKVFKEWNTAADGSGTSYAEGARVPSDVTLYAIWATELEVQYEDLVVEGQDTINQDLFIWEPVTEPGIAVVRHTANGTDGIVSRGDTPTVTTQKGTAKITGINWNYFADENFSLSVKLYEERTDPKTNITYPESTEYKLTVKTQAKKAAIENALRKLIIPYEVTKTENNVTKTYTVTAIDAGLLHGNEIAFDVPTNSGYQVPILASGSADKYMEQNVNKETDTTYLIIPKSVTTLGNLNLLPRDQIIFSSSNDIKQIPEKAFLNCIYASTISLPSGVTSIGNEAFKGCSSLASITIPNSVTSIGKCAFENCNALTTITIPSNVTTIGDEVFVGCGNLTQVTLPSSLTTIGKSAFDHCKELTTVTIPQNGNLTSIPEKMFYLCEKLTTVTIPNKVTSIGDNAFFGCNELETITIPDSVTTIGQDVFWGDDKLKTVIISQNSNLKTIGKEAFAYCYFLEEITIPNGVTSIAEGAFTFINEASKTLTTPGSVTTLTIPGSVKTVGNYAFMQCDALKTIVIEDGVETLGSRIFNHCDALESVTLPSSITSIGGLAFGTTPKLKTITYNGVTYRKIQELKNALIANNVQLPDYNTKDADGHPLVYQTFHSVKLEQDT